jgi:cell wall assembly regulator SMI1
MAGVLPSWSRIDAWLAAHAPRTHATLRAPVEAGELRRALPEGARLKVTLARIRRS